MKFLSFAIRLCFLNLVNVAHSYKFKTGPKFVRDDVVIKQVDDPSVPGDVEGLPGSAGQPKKVALISSENENPVTCRRPYHDNNNDNNVTITITRVTNLTMARQ